MIKFSQYSSVKSLQKIDIDLQDYIDAIKIGKYQDLVLQARANKKDKEKYKSIKAMAPCITGSAVMNNGTKRADNIKELNGLIVLDIDDDVNLQTLNEINKDKYTFVSHRSFGGSGLCVFVKINTNKFLESFNDLAQYYWDNFNVLIDNSCKNKNRLRYLSYDPYLFFNENASKFIARSKKVKQIEHNFIFVEDDFQNIMNQIQAQNIDLCQDDYDRYIRIGFAIASQYGSGGLQYFKAICQHGSKYEEDKIEKHYKGFLRTNGKVSISTIYYYAKEAGLTLYSEKTKSTIKRVSVAKSQGTPTLESVKKSLSKINKIDDADEGLINQLIESKKDYKESDDDVPESEQLKNFIQENYQPFRDGITNEIFVKNKLLDDTKLNTIYFACKNYFDFKPMKSDVRDMINSEYTKTSSPVKDFFKGVENAEKGYIRQYVNCIEPRNEYNYWVFKKWLVGCVHNWMAHNSETKVSPLTLVLCGQKQGTGKTSFFRNLLPKDLQKYLIEHKIDAKDKDSIYNLIKGLLVLDDEFGGLASKDVKDFKKIADTNLIDIRLPYSAYYSKMKRRASLCGTSNESDILKDVTGNRRILPINVEKIDYDKMIAIDTDKLWHEVYDLYINDFDWKIYTDKQIAYLEDNTQNNLESMPIEELFFNFFSLNESNDFPSKFILNKGEVLNYLNLHTSINVSKYDVNNIFVKNKLKYSTFSNNGIQKKGIKLYGKISTNIP